MESLFSRIDTIAILTIVILICLGVVTYLILHIRILRRECDQARRELRHEVERRMVEVERTKIEADRADAEAVRVGKLTSAINHALDRNVQMQEEMRRFLELMEKRWTRVDPPAPPEQKLSGHEPTQWPDFTRPAHLTPPKGKG